MRNAAAVVLGVLWILLLAAYTYPLWKPGNVSWDFAVSVVPPARMWMAVVFLGILLLLPPLLLGIATWYFMRRT